MSDRKKELREEKKEKSILWLSFLSGLLFAVVEYIFSIYSRSQSARMDAVYDASELIFLALILFMTPLFHQPISEKRPYGFFQVESIFLIIKGIMMLSVTFGVSADVIQSALHGGNRVNELLISGFQFLLGLVSVAIYFVMKRMNRDLSSPTIQMELLGWKLDIFYSMGLSLAFFGSAFLEKTPLAFVAPYFDQLMAVAVVLSMLPENIRALIGAVKDVFLFSPDADTVESVKSCCEPSLRHYGLHPVFFDVTRTGRRLWVSIYFEIDKESLYIERLREATDSLNAHLAKEFENCSCELILSPNQAEPVLEALT